MSGLLKRGNGKIITAIYIFLIGVFACTMTLSCTDNSETSEGSFETAENDDSNLIMENNNDFDNDLDGTGSGELDGEDLPDEEVDADIVDNDSDALVEEEAEEDVSDEESEEEEGQTDGEEIQNEEEDSEENVEEEIDYGSSDNFRIDVDLSVQKVFVYYKDNLIKTMICSGGTEEKPTPPGTYYTNQKIESAWVEKYNMYALFWVRFYNDYLFHSVPYDKDWNLLQEEYEKLGTPASHGCIRLALEDAEWLYKMLPLGVKVKIY